MVEGYRKQKPFPYLKAEELTVRKERERLKESLALLADYPGSGELTALPRETLNGLLTKSEQVALDIRAALSEKGEPCELLIDKKKECGEMVVRELAKSRFGLQYIFQTEEKMTEYGMDRCPVEVDYIDGVLSVYTPLTFKRGYTKSNYIANYLLANQVKTALINWQNEHRTELEGKIEAPFICVMKRVDKDFSLQKNCDGDNLENQKILNVLTDALCLPDSADQMSLYSIFKKAGNGEKTGMYFYLFPEKDLPVRLSILRNEPFDFV